MTWTTAVPTQPGFYWLREPGAEPVVVEVRGLYVTHPRRPGDLDLPRPGGPRSGITPDIDPAAEWAGPLVPPGG